MDNEITTEETTVEEITDEKTTVEEITAEEIAAHFSAMDDSVNLINNTVADDTESLRIYQTEEEVNLMVTRNTDHLEIQAKKYWYKDSLNNKISYDDAVTAGKAYVIAE